MLFLAFLVGSQIRSVRIKILTKRSSIHSSRGGANFWLQSSTSSRRSVCGFAACLCSGCFGGSERIFSDYTTHEHTEKGYLVAKLRKVFYTILLYLQQLRCWGMGRRKRGNNSSTATNAQQMKLKQVWLVGLAYLLSSFRSSHIQFLLE